MNIVEFMLGKEAYLLHAERVLSAREARAASLRLLNPTDFWNGWQEEALDHRDATAGAYHGNT